MGTYVTGYPGAQTRHNFCCDMSSTTVTEVIIKGSDYGDTLKFRWQDGTYNLQPTGTVDITGYIYGASGNDVIHGSNAYVDLFIEYLFGEGDDDTILGHKGYRDHLDGGAGKDTLLGGAGPDEMNGGTGSDTMMGGTGDDVMQGDEDNDLMSGGPGDDIMDGGTGMDVLCGGTGSVDMLNDGDTDAEASGEKLWGDDVGDTATCGNISTHMGPNTYATGSGCSTAFLTTEPPECP